MSSNIIEAVEHVTEHEEVFYLSAEFWVSVAFILTIIAIIKPALKVINNLINGRINRIKNELNKAEILKHDAQKLYSDYERKLFNLDNEINDIINEERLIISEDKEKKTRELDAILRKKQVEIDGKIELMYEQTKTEINKLIADKTFTIIEAIIKKKITKSIHNKLIDKTINNIAKMEN